MNDIYEAFRTVSQQNEQLAATLREARDQIVALRDEVDRLAQSASGFGTFIRSVGPDKADVSAGGRQMRVTADARLDISQLRSGQAVIINESMNIVDTTDNESLGEIVTLRNLLDDGRRAVVVATGDEELVVQLAEPLRGDVLNAGDSLLFERRSGFVYERFPETEVEGLLLEETPDITYSDVGGLSCQIEQVRDAIELPYLHKDLFAQVMLRPTRGVLLYGPPGCGKTLIAKAVANSLARQIAARSTGSTSQSGPEDRLKERSRGAGSYFLNIKGPELLNKYVGETERNIRLVFQRAKEKAGDGVPVMVFFDEMDAIFRTRGSGVSSDVENTVVPQLLSEIDGVESLNNVVVIGASSREDMIDPAILRPGRLDVKIKIERPDTEDARDILSKYLVSSLPIHIDDLSAHGGNVGSALAGMIHQTVGYLYSESDDNKFVEVTYESGTKETIYFRDFSSGAILASIVDRAKLAAIKRYLDNGSLGIKTQDLLDAAAQEISAIEELTDITNPDDWARISGRKGERITFIRTLTKRGDDFTGRSISLDRTKSSA